MSTILYLKFLGKQICQTQKQNMEGNNKGHKLSKWRLTDQYKASMKQKFSLWRDKKDW
jgi:hypothetical protein